MPVAIRIHRLCHPVIGFRTVKELGCKGKDRFRLRSGELYRPGRNRLRPLRFAAKHQHRLAERRGFLLNAAGICHDQIALRHETVHIHSVERRDQPNIFHAAQQFLRRAAHDRAQMYGIDDQRVGIRKRQPAHGGKNVAHGLPIVFPPVAGKGNDALCAKINRIQLIRSEPLATHGISHCVDDRVAGNKNISRYGFPFQIVGVIGGRRKVQRGDPADERAVHLLREGRPTVKGTQTSLHMADRDFGVKRRERPGEGGCRIAVDKHQIGLRRFQHGLHPIEHTRSDAGQILTLLHNVQVIVRLNAKLLHHGIQHLTVLRRDANHASDLGAFLKLQYQRRHFDCFRTCTENGQDFNLLAHLTLLALHQTAFDWTLQSGRLHVHPPHADDA